MSWDGRSCKVVPESLVGAHPFGSWLSSCDSLLVLIWVRAIVLLLPSMVGFHRQEVMEKETLSLIAADHHLPSPIPPFNTHKHSERRRRSEGRMVANADAVLSDILSSMRTSVPFHFWQHGV